MIMHSSLKKSLASCCLKSATFSPLSDTPPPCTSLRASPLEDARPHFTSSVSTPIWPSVKSASVSVVVGMLAAAPPETKDLLGSGLCLLGLPPCRVPERSARMRGFPLPCVQLCAFPAVHRLDLLKRQEGQHTDALSTSASSTLRQYW